jgi:hypothetical protein
MNLICYCCCVFRRRQGSNRHNTSLVHYGGSFGSEQMQTSMPSCMNRLHNNYLWSSKVVSGSEVCNRAAVCSVFNRPSSNIAKVDRSGEVVFCSPTSMEAAVMAKGGRAQDSVSVAGMHVGGSESNYHKSQNMHAHMIARMQSASSAQAAGAIPRPSPSSVCGSSAYNRHFQQPCLQPASPTSLSESRYTYMDEEYLQRLHTGMKWERDNGIIHLMPIAVVYQEDVY